MSASADYPQPGTSPRVTRPETDFYAETKASFKTTELMLYIAAVAGILIASAVVDGEPGPGDRFGADQAWLYITLLTIGYMISRGLAKSGTRQPEHESHGDRRI